MKEQPSAGGIGRGRVIKIASIVLVILGIALLIVATRQLTGLGQEGSDGGSPTITPMPIVEERPPDGKILPTAPAHLLADFPTVPETIEQSTMPDRGTLDLERLYGTVAPIHDYFATAEELGHVDLGERTRWLVDYRVGERVTFRTADGPREAELVFLDELATYWVETGLSIDRAALVSAAGRLSNEYYPLLSHHFGQEWRPGVDGDPRFTVLLVASTTDTVELGYFTDENQYPTSLFGESNAREMIYLNIAQLKPGTPLFDGTLVHEAQHLIQWNLDANEDKWFNEGLSQIAESIAGLDTVGTQPYLEQTNIRLDRWADFPPDIHAHYAGSYLYLLYLWEQAGSAALTEVARHPANGLGAVRSVLAGHAPNLSLEAFTADWATALYLDGQTDDPRYNMLRFDLSPPFYANRVRQLPFEAVSTTEQFAIDYIDLDLRGPATIFFAGDTVAPLVDEPPGKDTIWFAPPANSARAQLTASVDLTGLANSELSFSTWFDLEPAYDFAYLSVSTDGGETWRIMEPIHAVPGAYGPGWGGQSTRVGDAVNGWLQEQIDLSPYAGQSIQLRFDVVTDFEIFGRGFAIDNLALTNVVEQPIWQATGFVETGTRLPQRWEVRLIREGQNPMVFPLALDSRNRARANVDFGAEGGVLVIMPLLPYVESAANYWLAVERGE